MGKILAVATHATDEEAVYLAKEEVAKSVHGVGFPPLPELIDQVVEGGVPVYV
jgi:predicted peroxiredoxin